MQFRVSPKVGAPLFAVAGLVILGVEASMFLDTLRFVRSAQPTEATIVGYEEHVDSEDASVLYAPVFSFTVSEATYRVTSSMRSSNYAFSQGEQVDVLYNPAAPQDAEIRTIGRIYGPVIGGGILSLAFLLSGGIPSWIMLKKKRKKDRLRTQGVRVDGVVQSIEVDPYLSVNGVNGRRVIATVDDPMRGLRTLTSGRYWWVVEDSLRSGQTVPIYLDPHDPDCFFFDLEP